MGYWGYYWGLKHPIEIVLLKNMALNKCRCLMFIHTKIWKKFTYFKVYVACRCNLQTTVLK